jgi:hypothetical protein
MSFGGFAPLPERLGTDPETARSAAQHARLVADTVALRRVADLCSFAFSTNGSTATVSNYDGANGEGLAWMPDSIVVNGTGDVSFRWASRVFVDEYETARPVAIRGFEVGGAGSAFVEVTGELIDGGVRVRLWNAAGAAVNGAASVTLHGGVSSTIGDYDGAFDKEDSITEGPEPYAYQWYRNIEAMLGDGFTTVRRGLVHAKKLALARTQAGLQRTAERALANSIPETADECLEAWAEALAVPLRDGAERWRVRQQCAAKFQTNRGPTASDIDVAVESILGDLYVESIRQNANALSAPPPQTFWPSGTPGPMSLALGGYAWFSERSHLTVRVTYPQAGDEGEFFRRVNTDLFQYLDRRLPATATFNWAAWRTEPIGFYLDSSPLDFTGLTPS